jgi:hypothetical protein
MTNKSSFFRFFIRFWLWIILLTIALFLVEYYIYLDINAHQGPDSGNGHAAIGLIPAVIAILTSLALFIVAIVFLVRKRYAEAGCLTINFLMLAWICYRLIGLTAVLFVMYGRL